MQLTVSALQRYPHAGRSRRRRRDAEAFDGVLLAVPSPQAGGAAAAALWATRRDGAGGAVGLLGADGALDAPLAVDFDAAFVNRGPLRWVARDRSKPGRERAGDLVAARERGVEQGAHEDAPERVAVALVGASGLGGRMPLGWAAHRWRYAIADPRSTAAAPWDAAQALGLCGDYGQRRPRGGRLAERARARAPGARRPRGGLSVRA